MTATGTDLGTDFPAVAAFEVYTFTAALQVLDAVEKSAGVQVLMIELNDNFGLYFMVGGETAQVLAARAEAEEIATQNGLTLQAAKAFERPDAQLTPLIAAPDEYNGLIEQDVLVTFLGIPTMANDPNYALGFIETRGFTAVTAAADAAVKAANVEVLAKEKLGGGFITLVFQGDVAAVKAAVEAACENAAQHGEVIASNVIARPSEGVRKVLTKI